MVERAGACRGQRSAALARFGLINRGQDWRDALARTRDEEAAEIAALRHATRTGRPLGSEQFVQRLEGMFGRKLNGKRTGRPRKEQTAGAGK